MTTADRGTTHNGCLPQPSPTSGKAAVPVHRIGIVRRQQGISLRSIARQTGDDVATLRRQEQAETDLRLSDLYAWQQALDVPVADLLVEPSPQLSRGVHERAHLVRVMKTAAAILEQSRTQPLATQRMAKMLVEQLIELMPELADIGPWHSVGQRRSLEEYGRAAERCMPETMFHHSDD